MFNGIKSFSLLKGRLIFLFLLNSMNVFAISPMSPIGSIKSISEGERIKCEIVFDSGIKGQAKFSPQNIVDNKIFEVIEKHLTPEELIKHGLNKDGYVRRNFHLNNDEAHRIKLAEILAKLDSPVLGEIFQNFNISNETERIRIAEMYAKSSPRSLIKFFQNFNLTKEVDRVKISNLILNNVADQEIYILIAKYFLNFAISNPNERVRLAKLVAEKNPGTLASNIKNFNITDEADRVKLAKFVAEEQPWSLTFYFQNFNITSEAERVKLAKLVANRGLRHLAEDFQNFNITAEAERVKLARFVAEKNPEYLVYNIQNFNITNEAERVKLAKLVAETEPWSLAEYLQNFNITDEAVRVKLAMLVAEKEPWSLSKYIQNFNITDEAERVIKLFISLEKIQSIPELKDRLKKKDEIVVDLPFKDIEFIFSDKIQDLDLAKKALRLVAAMGSSVGKPIQSYRDLVVQLFPQKIQSDILSQLKNQKGDSLKELYSVIFDIVLFKNSLVEHNFSESGISGDNQINNILMPNLLVFKNDLFMESTLFASSYREGFLRLLLSFRNELNTRNILEMDLPTTNELNPHSLNNGSQIQNIKLDQLVKLPLIVNSSNLDLITNKIEKLTVNRVKSILGSVTSISEEKLYQLEKKWGDIGPLYTLISRFYGNENWKKELIPLGKVFEADLINDFTAYKYKGIRSLDSSESDIADQQLQGLTIAGVQAWMKDRTKVELLDQQQGKDANESNSGEAPLQRNTKDPVAGSKLISQFLQNMSVLLTSNLIPHIEARLNEIHQNQIQSTKLKLTSLPKEVRKNLFTQVLNTSGPPTEILQKVEVDTGLVAFQIYSSLSIEIKNKVETFLQEIRHFDASKESYNNTIQRMRVLLKEMEKLIKFIRSNLRSSNTSNVQLEDDISALIKETQWNPNQLFKESESNTLLVTTFSGNAKYLLTIGDAVATSSCQNYRTGAYIETLLGYVIDANVKAMTSFLLNKNKHFDSPEEFERLKVAISEKSLIKEEFNGYRNQFLFTLRDGSIIKTKYIIEKAYLRQIVKVGQSEEHSGSASIVLERPYSQTNNYSADMMDSQLRMFQSLADDMGVVTKGNLKIVGSRNPGGVYSDLAGGSMTGDYIIVRPQE